MKIELEEHEASRKANEDLRQEMQRELTAQEHTVDLLRSNNDHLNEELSAVKIHSENL